LTRSKRCEFICRHFADYGFGSIPQDAIQTLNVVGQVEASTLVSTTHAPFRVEIRPVMLHQIVASTFVAGVMVEAGRIALKTAIQRKRANEQGLTTVVEHNRQQSLVAPTPAPFPAQEVKISSSNFQHQETSF
jgi:hypothetical protein